MLAADTVGPSMNDFKNPAPHAGPGRHVWATAKKSLVGTALGSSRVWFTLGRGILTEVFYPRIDMPALRDLGFIVSDGRGFWVELKANKDWVQTLPDCRVPFSRIEHRHERFHFRFEVAVDPHRDVLLLDYELEGDRGLGLYVLCAPRLVGDSEGHRAYTGVWEGRELLWAEYGPYGLALLVRDPEGRAAFVRRSVGEVGASDLWQDFSRHGAMTWSYDMAGPGEVALGAEIPRRGTLALGLGSSKEAAATLAWASLAEGYRDVAADYAEGWLRWHERHAISPRGFAEHFSPTVSDLYRRSLVVLKTHADRTFRGSMVASLSVPWGEDSESRGGYHLVWSRDLVESAGALLAAGMLPEARSVLCYLISTQQADGHWLQNQWLGGKPFWQGIQLDETAFPVLLAAALRDAGALGDIVLDDMLTRALSFLLREGPVTGQDRWEEDAGLNTFTLAVAIAALVEGGEILGGRAAQCAGMVADYWNARLEDWTYICGTGLARRYGVRGYYLRISPEDALGREDAKTEWVLIKNRAHDPHLPASEQVSTDFLQLVRFGLRRPDDPVILDTLKVVDGLLRTETPRGPVWHRYNGDGYGEHRDGSPFDGTGIGRGWPLLVGERGHYALVAGEDARPYLEIMAAMTGEGGLIPEQVWDSDPIAEKDLFPGEPSGSAMPLVWAHGEFIKLCHSVLAGHPVDRPSATWARYRGRRPSVDYTLWTSRLRPIKLYLGQELRILLPEPFVVHWGHDGWQDVRETPSEDWTLAHVAILPTRALPLGAHLDFTIRWVRDGRWWGQDFSLEVVGDEHDRH